MKESYGEGRATHTGPKSCAAIREGGGEALTGVRAGRVLSRERTELQGADAVKGCGRHHLGHRQRTMAQSPAWSATPCTYGHTSRENRELLSPPRADGAVGRVGKSTDTRR
jgi:RNA-directed DNA polymerase